MSSGVRLREDLEFPILALVSTLVNLANSFNSYTEHWSLVFYLYGVSAEWRRCG